MAGCLEINAPLYHLSNLKKAFRKYPEAFFIDFKKQGKIATR